MFRKVTGIVSDCDYVFWRVGGAVPVYDWGLCVEDSGWSSILLVIICFGEWVEQYMIGDYVLRIVVGAVYYW